jgi:hypothetical protein
LHIYKVSNLTHLDVFRILATAPTVKSSVWDLTKYVMDNLHQLLSPRRDTFVETDIYSQKIKSMYEEDPILKQFNHVGHRRSIVDLSAIDNIDEPDFEVRGNILSRRNSAVPSISSHHNLMSGSIHSTIGDLETLDQVANAASHHDTLYSYHYMNETDQTVIFYAKMVFDQNLTQTSMTITDEVHQNSRYDGHRINHQPNRT